MFNHNSETKGHGSIRKNKVYGTIGVIALGAIAMFSNNKTASADEVSSSEPTTTTAVASAADTSLAVQSQAASAEAAAPATATDSTAPTANATAPVEATSPAAPAAESTPTALASSASDTTPVTYTAPPAAPAKATETEPVKVDSTGLDNAVEDAKKAGVEVTREADVDRGTATTPQETEQKIAEIKNDYKKQTEEIKSVTEAAKVDTAKYNEAKTQYDTAKAEYDVKKSEYDTAKAKYDYDLAQYHVLKTQYDTAKAQYDRDLAAYNEAKLAYAVAKTRYDVDKEAYDKAKTTYDTDKAAYDIAKANYDAARISYDAAKVKYEKDLEKYKEDRVAYNIAKTAYDEAQNKYVEDLAQYNKDKAAYDTAKEAYDTAKATYDTAKTQYDSDLAKYKVDKAAYDVAKTTYDRELAQYQVYKEQYDAAKTQYDRDLGQYQILKAQYDAAKTQYAIDKAAYDQAKAQYTVDKAAYDKAKAQYDAALAKYKADSEQYKRDMEEYTRAMIEAEAKKHQDGYLTEAKSQSLIFKSEPNAIRSVDPSVRQYTKKELDDLVRSWGISPTNPDKTKSTAYSYFNQINSNNAYARLVLEKNKPVDVTYTGLQNSSFNGKKISKVVYTYTLKATEFGDGTKMSMYASDDPTITAWYNDFFTSTNINVKVKFYGEDGELIDPTGSLVSFSSLNRGNGSGAVYKDAIESVRYFNGKLIPISGSSIKIQANNSAYANSSNAEKALGSRWETLEWDTAESDKKWYGAIVGEVTQPEISFNMVSYKSGNVWFAFNSDIKAIGVPIKPVEPVEPEAPTAPVEPKAPTAPVEPVAPTAPVEPKAPTAPVEPKAPTAPVEPKAPTAPVEPKAPTAPVEPKAPTAPVEPKAPTAPVEPKAPTAPVEPKAPTAPVEPKAPTAPVEPKAPTPPTTPAIRTAKYHYNTLKSTIEYGNVVVDYQDKQGNTISPRIVDTPDVRVGTAYDTTDHKTTTITTADGTIYRIDTSATQGNESGQVVKGTTRVVYVYDKVEKPVEKKYGDVTVEYKNKDGVTIAPKVTDTPRSEVGTDYDTKDQRKDTITTVDGKQYKLDLTATQGAEIGKVVEGNTTIVYYYDLVPEKKYGDVTVEYKNKDGVTIAPKVTDTPRSEVGTDYDTKDQRKDTITTVDGKQYKLDLTATQGTETGKVVEGNTTIVYYYDLVPDAPQKKYGDVTVEYKNKDGVTIAPKVTDTPRSEVGTDYDTKDQRKDTITTVDGKQYKLDLTATQGTETGKVVEGNTNVVYYYDLVPDAPQKKYGDVTVEYKNKDGVTIAPKVTDTPRSEVGTDYDTKDQRKDTITTVDGKQYKLDLTATQGAEIGKVVEGNTTIVYYYDLVPEKKYGDVTVEYKNKDGVTIAPKVTDTPRSEVGTDYDTKDQRKDTITTVDGKQYKLDLTATQGTETGKVVEGNTTIVYYYDLVPEKKYGDVTVEYKNKDGVTIAPKVTDTPRSEVGTDYDTKDQRKDTITTVDGKQYKLDLTATQGTETGKVVEGNTNVVYYYDLVPDAPQKKYGDVTVEYKNKDGVTIAPKVTDTPRSEVGTDYDTKDQRKDTITTVDGKQYKLDLTATQGTETGKVVEGNTTIVYYYDLVPEKKYGDVTVEYKNKDGVTIAPKVTDTPRSEVGTDYDTKDQRKDTITTVDGKQYKLDLTATQGTETGKVVEGNTTIVYYYDLVPDAPQKKYGDVTVEYKNKDGVTIAPKVTDTPRSEVGTDYDTKDQRKDTITTVDGKKYKLDLTATQGAEIGKVVEGNTTIVYYYDLVPEKKYGDVTVEYKNKDGVTIAPKVTDTPRSEVGTDYDTKDQRKDTITTVDGKKYKLDLTATQGTETGKVVEGNTTIVYYYDLVKTPEEYGNVVVDYQDKKGNTIAPRIVDTPTAKVGTAYDTTDHKPVTIVSSNGKTYRIDPTATQGQESGEVVKGTTRVVYVYDEVLGDVTVHYTDEQGTVIKEPEKDTTGAPINTLYDTRDHAHKTITTQDGRVYEIIPEKAIGLEQGRIVEGNTDVTYVYKEVFGDVVVRYVDESGKKIKEDVTDTARGKVGEDYDTTDHKIISIKHGNKVYNIVPEKTKGQEKGKVVKGVTEVTYVYKAVQAEPKKLGTNAKGEDVNGKTMLAGSTEVYTINIDNDQYKGTTGLVDQDKQAGLMVVEKYSSKFVTPNLDAVRMTTEDGKVVSGFTTKIYKSVAEAPQKVQDYIKAKGLTIDGEFAVTTSDDPVAYTNNYALKGINLKLIFPTTVKKDIKEASKYDNKAYQIDFAGIAETNIVTNNIPKINPKKDIVATVEDGLKDQNSLNGKTIKVGAVYNFELNTSYLPAKRGQSIDKIEVKDTYSPLVEYNGVHKWIANTDILLKDNTKIAKGTDLTQYVNQDIDHQARTVVYSFSNDFLSKVSDDSEFQAIGYMQVKQLDYGTVKNTFTEIINNVERDSNTVTLVSPKEYGDVVVRYVDESGKKIKEDVTDTARGKVGEDYDTTDHKIISIKHGNKVYNIVPEKTKGQEKGKVVKGVTEVTYVYKAVQAEPKKLGTNAKGEDVNGKTMLAGSTEVYTINIDNDQYKGTTGLVDQDKQAGLMVVEKYSSKFVTPNLDAVRMTTEDGKVVSGFTTKIYKSVAEAPQKVQDYIKAKGLTIDGEFAVTTSDDPVAYTNNYALKGINLKLIFPTTVKKDIKEASKYDNKAYQIDFAGIAETNIVTNNIPKINPKKDIVATVEDGLKDQNSLNGKTIKVGAVYNFELNTSYLPAKRGQSIDKIEVKDTYSPLVEYNGVHKWIANTDILLKDNTKIAKGTDLTQYVNQDIDHQARTVVYSFSNDFLSKVSDDSEFQAIGYMQVKQLDYGTVKNTFTEIINNVERDSNTVTLVSPKEYGDVVVRYVDESGKKIKEDVTDTARGKVGEDYDTTDHKIISIKHGNKVYNIVPEKTKGQEKGKVVKGVTEVTYVYKAVQAEPKKLGTNAKGEDVNGKTMLAGSTEVYTINIDNDQYKGTTGLVDQDKQAGLMVVEKYSSKFVTPNLDAVRMTTEDGKVVSGFTTKIYKSVAEAPQKVQDYIKAKGLTIDGEFAVTTSDDPVAYTNNYALKGINLKLIFPTTVKKDIKEASKYDNKAYQIDFAGIAETNIVTNNIPKINPKKDIVATVEDGLKDQNSLNGKTIKVGAVYNFELNTSYLPAKRGQSIDKIEVKDTYSPLVEYNGVHKWIANTDILLKDNTKIAKGTDLTQYVNQDIDHQARTVVYSFSNDFLSKVSDDSEFQAIGYMQVKQLDYGTVKNTFTEIINNVERDSNTVTVVTPEKPQTPPEKPQTPPEKPQTPPEKPQTPPATPTTPVVPTTPQTELPETGETDHTGAAVLGLAMVVSAMSIIGSKKRKEEE